MKRSDYKASSFPDKPGVYFFINDKDEVLYIGKATSLRTRLRSYFSDDLDEKRSPLIKKMVKEAARIDWRELDSVLEALIVETNLIRTHKPVYNTKSKDDKSFVRVIFTNEDWPRVLVVRERDVYEQFTDKDIKYDFGPYTSSTLLRQALKIIQKIFRFYDTEKPIGKEANKIQKGYVNFNRQIGLYPEAGDKQNYQKTIRHLRLFFEGKKQEIIKELEKEMFACARREEFEQAEVAKHKIMALKHIDDISLVKRETLDDIYTTTFRIEAYDVSHHSGKEMVGVMTVVDQGEPQRAEYRRFKIKHFKQANDPGALREMIKRRLNHLEWDLPKLIVVDGNSIQQKVVQDCLWEQGLSIPVAAVVKNEKHKVDHVILEEELLQKYQYDIILANAESHRFALSYHHLLARKKLLS